MLETKYGMKYPFPHTLVHIVDNSAYTGDLPVVVADDPSMYGTIVVSGFPMGEDNRMIGITRSDILNIAYGLSGIGASEIQKYGQTITYPVSLLDQGAPIQLMRVTPSDATYAYSCIVVEWAWDNGDENGQPTLHVRYNTAKLDNDRDLMNYKNRERLAAAIMASVKKDPDPDDRSAGLKWYRRAFLVNVSAGRGAAYNNFATSVNQTIQQKKPANARYLFTTTDMRSNTTVEQYIASLINDNNTDRTDATDNVNVIMGRRAAGSSVVVQYLNEDAIRELYTIYHDKFADMIANNESTIDEYDRNVFRSLNINTFDPIFGLYLYNGTDETQKLPFFQVDMVESNVPRLDESNILYYDQASEPPIDEPSYLLSEKLMKLTLGFGTYTKTDKNGNSLDTVLLGDMYLYSGFATTNNPYIYIVAAINQYTGAVTTVRTNQLHFYGTDVTTGSEIEDDSQLKTIIDASTQKDMLDVLKRRISSRTITDGDTFAWYDGTVWKLFYMYNMVNNTDAMANAIANGYIIEYSAEALKDYSFINWDATAASNLIGVKTGDPALTRIGATCIDSEGNVYVNGLTSGEKIEVQRPADYNGFTNYSAPPTTVSNVVADVIGSAYDLVKCNKADSNYVYFTSDPIKYTPASGIIGIPEGERLGWKPYNNTSSNNKVLMFTMSEGTGDDAGKLLLTYETDGEAAVDLDKTYFSKYVEGTPLYIARNIVRTNVVAIAPAWDATKFYFDAETGGNKVSAPTAEFTADPTQFYVADTFDGERTQCEASATWDPSKFYFDAATSGNPVSAAPDDWATNFGSYFVANTVDGDRTAVTAAGYEVDPLVDKKKGFIYYGNKTGEYFLYDGTDLIPQPDLKSDDQILRVYKKTPSGNWIYDTDDGGDQDAGYAIPTEATTVALDVSNANTVLDKTMDSNNATNINRYVVVGTIGSLYRSQVSNLSINPDYYSDEYGINFTSTYGGVQLEDGSTGFFDRTDISPIEFKWLYAKLIVDAFRGKIDPRIMSPVKCPAKYLFDGAWNTVVGQLTLPTMNYSAADIVAASTMYTEDEKDEVLFNPSITDGWDGSTDVDVKQAMYDLMDYRVYQGIPEDKRPLGPGSGLSLHLDSGVTDEATAQVINKSFVKRFDNPNASWDIGGVVSSRDGLPYTFTKFIVDNLVRHCKENTVNKPFTGIYTKILKNEYVSYFPDIDTTDWEYRELMYNSGGNAWLPDVNGVLMRRSQRTLMRGSDTSDLIQESNMRTLSQLVYLLQNKLEEKLFEYNDDSVLRTMQDEVNNMFSNWAGNMVESLNISFVRDINPNDGGEIVVCYVDVVFRGINLRIPVIVNVNRRIASTT